MFRTLRPGVALFIALSVGAPGVASAAPSPRDSAKALIAEVEKTPAAKGAARDALAEAARALVRADRARLAGDERHGAALEALAYEWAQAAKDLERAAAAEARATALEKELGEASAKLEQAHTLIEQTNARRNRAEAQLKDLDAERAAPHPAPDAQSSKAPKAPKKRAAPEKGGSE